MGLLFRVLVIAWALALSACASTDTGKTKSAEEFGAEALPPPVTTQLSPEGALEVPEPLEETVAEAEAMAESQPDDQGEDEEPELKPEDFEEGFCLDDIYATYLTRQFAKDNPKAKTAPEPSKTRRRGNVVSEAQRQRFLALSHARDVMNGKTTPYFGAIPIVVNDKVDFWVQYYKTAGRRQFMQWLVRGEATKKMVQPVLKELGVPIEFFYLAMIESGFSNSAYSHARATGTWQFMKGTAQLYGLKINHWVDERRDPVKSTIAAATYLKDLYAELGDWHLAMAAYNAGPGKLRKAARLSKTRDFWKIVETKNLAKETKQYVPKVLAAILLAADAKGHGFEFTGVESEADTLPETEVVVKRPVQLDELAAKLNLPLKTLMHWNPELIRNITPPGKYGYSLRLAASYANAFPKIEQGLSFIQVTDIQMHTVRKGDTLSRIAKHYNVAVKQIMTVNPDLKASRLKPGHAIAIPIPGVVTKKGHTQAPADRKVL